MSGIITITTEQDWMASNWIYWNLMDQIRNLVSDEADVLHFVEQCKWMHGLDIPEMKNSGMVFYDSVIIALQSAVQMCALGTVVAKVDGRILDDESQRQFRQATHDLAVMLSALDITTPGS